MTTTQRPVRRAPVQERSRRRVEALLDATERLVELPLIDTDPQRVARAVELLGGGTPSYATYFTDASVLAGALGGADTIVCGPGEPEQCHVTDEWAPADLVDPAAEAYRRVLAELT